MDFSGFDFTGIGDVKPSTSPTKMSGSDDVYAPGGWLYTGEKNSKLVGLQKWVTYDNVIQGTLIVAAALRIFDTLLGSAKWSAEANKLGGRGGQKMADLVQEGLIDASMPKPWSSVVKKTGTGAKFKGFCIHEWAGHKRNTPGAPWVFSNIEHRPQHTIQQWIKPNEREPWVAVIQRLQTGSTFPLARNKLFYLVDDTISDSPQGEGYLRHVVEHADHLRDFERLEGVNFQRNIAGIPVGRAPLSKLRNAAISAGVPADDEAAIKTWVDVRTKFMRDIVENHIVTPKLGILLDSQPFISTDDKGTPSSIYQWTLEQMKGTGMGFTEVRSAIGSVGRELARVMCCEWLLMGDSEGARAVHGDKTAMFGLVINSVLQLIGYYATSQLAWAQTGLNGMDTETCTPHVKPAPIPMDTIESVCRSLQLLSQAGRPIPPGWEGVDVILDRADLPPFPDEVIDAALPKPAPGQPKGGTPKGTAAAKPAEPSKSKGKDTTPASAGEQP